MNANPQAARTILLIVAASYVLSAALLAVARLRGTAVGLTAIGGWLALGVVGVGLALTLAPGRPLVWVGLLLALGPWMVHATVGDARLGAGMMVAVDVAGLFAIGYGLWLGRQALTA